MLELLARQLNRVLRMDSRYPGILSGLHGKVVAVELTDLDRTFIVRISREGLEPGRTEDVVDVRIRGTLPALLAYVSAQDGRRSAQLELHGNVSVAQDLQEILAGLDLDWEEALAQRTGDIAARKIGNFGRGFARHARGALRSLALDTSEYLRFESRLLPVRFEVEQFAIRAEALRDDAERLRLRLDRAARRMSRPP